MKALTRVEKFQKLRDEISRMPDDSELSSEQKSVGYEIAQTKKSQVSDIKAGVRRLNSVLTTLSKACGHQTKTSEKASRQSSNKNAKN